MHIGNRSVALIHDMYVHRSGVYNTSFTQARSEYLTLECTYTHTCSTEVHVWLYTYMTCVYYMWVPNVPSKFRIMCVIHSCTTHTCTYIHHNVYILYIHTIHTYICMYVIVQIVVCICLFIQNVCNVIVHMYESY